MKTLNNIKSDKKINNFRNQYLIILSTFNIYLIYIPIKEIIQIYNISDDITNNLCCE